MLASVLAILYVYEAEKYNRGVILKQSDLKNSKWNRYYKSVSNKKPRETLKIALDIFKDIKDERDNFIAVDLGCGNGPDTITLLKSGWEVIAIDGEVDGLKIIEECVPKKHKKKLNLLCEKFENISLPKADLVNASYSLPFCLPDSFEELWIKITNAIKVDGIFVGNFFGTNDTWAVKDNMTFHTKEQLEKMFEDFEIKHFEEVEDDGSTATGELKHWHVFNVVASKKHK